MHTTELPMEYRPTHINYPKSRRGYGEPKVNFSWRTSRRGQIALLMLHYFQQERISTMRLAHEARFSQLGINRRTVEELLRVKIPNLFAEYESTCGKQLTGAIIMGRLYMWYLDHDKENRVCVRTVTDEHPMVWGPRSGLCDLARQIYLGLEEAE
uniref:Uncharacterized protein n=1 Tax=Pseudomonas phage PAKlein3 TaxID=3230132 RepID=A0AAU8GRQ6_9VIRU